MSQDSKKPNLASVSDKSDARTMDIARIREETFDGLWADLQPHAERGAVILAINDLDLAEVALRIALDDKDAVAGWLAKGAISRPSAHQLQAWSVSPDHMFRLVIVAPYVVIQDLSN